MSDVTISWQTKVFGPPLCAVLADELDPLKAHEWDYYVTRAVLLLLVDIPRAQPAAAPAWNDADADAADSNVTTVQSRVIISPLFLAAAHRVRQQAVHASVLTSHPSHCKRAKDSRGGALCDSPTERLLSDGGPVGTRVHHTFAEARQLAGASSDSSIRDALFCRARIAGDTGPAPANGQDVADPLPAGRQPAGVCGCSRTPTPQLLRATSGGEILA